MSNVNQKRVKVPKIKGSSFIIWIIAAATVAPVAMAIYDNLPFTVYEKKGKSFYVKGGETRPVLNPSLFKGQIRQAYAIAKEYPKLLDEIPCYCYCDEEPFNHKSLLSCFTEKHGVS